MGRAIFWNSKQSAVAVILMLVGPLHLRSKESATQTSNPS